MDLDSYAKDNELIMSVDTETTGFNVATGEDFCIGVSIAGTMGGKPFKEYFPFAHEAGGNFNEETHAMLKWVLENDTSLIIFANAQFDILSLQTVGIDVEYCSWVDICTMAHLINENWPKDKGVDSLARYYLHEPGKIVDDFVEAEKKSGNRTITPEQMYDYAVMDAVSTWRVWDQLKDHDNWVSLPEYLWPHKVELVHVLLAMKRRGVQIDTDLAQEQIALGEAAMKRAASELGYPATPKKPTKMYPNPDPDPLPVLGPTALTEIFIERLGLPVVKKSVKTGKPSFDKEAMGEYEEMLERLDSPEAKLVKEYRGWQKAVSAAYRPYVERLELDGRLRCSYKLHGTVTGRFSCSEPNLQQIPKTSDKPWNGRVKECFVAREGYTLINADFSQLELRLGTAYAGEEELRQVFAEGRDIFTEMSGSLGFDRQTTKTFVYSTQYGAGPPRIMSAFGVSEAAAKQMLRTYRNTYPRFAQFAKKCAETAERDMKIRMWNGRYRHFEYASEGYKAMNSVIQGGAADIVERVMCQVYRELDSEDCRMLLQVHDSITFEVRTELVDEYIPRIKECMEDVSRAVGHDLFDVKFAVEVERWVA
jgi:DNA polymerase-1